MSQAVTHKYFLLHHFDRHSSQQNFFRFRPGIWWTSLPHSRQRLHAELDLSICWYAESCVKMWLSGFCTGESWFVKIMYRQINIYQGHVQAFRDLSGLCTGIPWFIRVVYRHSMIYQGCVQALHDLSGSCTGRLKIIRILSSFPLPYYITLWPRTLDTITRYDRHFSRSYSVHGRNAFISRFPCSILQNAIPCPEIPLLSRLPSLSIIVYIVFFPSCQVLSGGSIRYRGMLVNLYG